MSKRGALKLLAFLVGLYFVLEYVLPEKLGGDFDSYEVRAPAGCTLGGTTLVFYVGHYRAEQCALGRMRWDAAAGVWLREPNRPVLQPAVFQTHERYGMSQLALQAQGDVLTLLYLGRNMQREPVLCFATSRDAGLTWRRGGPVVVATNQQFVSSAVAPNGALPGALQFYAAHYDGVQWRMLLICAAKGLLLAHGPTLTNMTVLLPPRRSVAQLPINIVAFDAQRVSNAWRAYFVADGRLQTLLLSDQSDESDQSDISEKGVCALRLGPAPGVALVGVTRAPQAARAQEQAPLLTELYCAPAALTGAWTLIKSVGAPARPTYLTRGIKWAGDFTMIVGGFAVFMAVINLFLYHSKRIAQRQPGLHNSVLFFVFMVVMGVFTFFGSKPGEYGTQVIVHAPTPAAAARAAALKTSVLQAFNTLTNINDKRVTVALTVQQAGPAVTGATLVVRYIGTLPARQRAQVLPLLQAGVARHARIEPATVQVDFAPDAMKTGFDFTFKAFLVPLGIATFSTITFYMISAAYRAFKIRSAEAVLLMVAAFIVMIGQLPLGAWLTHAMPDQLFFLQMPWLAQKLLMVANSSAFRGVLIGIMIGGLAAGLRIWLGMDESVYAGLDK
jgi:hypothetical protein